MKLVLSVAAAMAALSLAACGDDPSRTAASDQQEASRENLPQAPGSAPDTGAPSGTLGNPNPGQPLDPTDPNALPPGSPPPVLPATPPS